MAKELGPSNIRVNSLCPGMISTLFHDTFTKDAVRSNVANAIALKREGGADEVAGTVAYLASSESSFLTGVNLDINGGFVLLLIRVNSIVIEEILRRLKSAPVVPLVAPNDVESAIRTTKALVDGGLSVVEVVLRTPAAVTCLGEIVRAVPEAIVGAGTVLSTEQAKAVIDEGAKFIVLPGLHAPVIELAQQAGIPIFPGVATATEAQNGWNMGLRTLKFFPASLAGGVPMLKALGSVFKGVSFMPTGGVSAANLPDYLALPGVVACGGSWLTPKSAIEQGDYHVITELAAEAVKIAKTVRG